MLASSDDEVIALTVDHLGGAGAGSTLDGGAAWEDAPAVVAYDSRRPDSLTDKRIRLWEPTGCVDHTSRMRRSRMFAPRVMRSIYADELRRLDAYARGAG